MKYILFYVCTLLLACNNNDTRSIPGDTTKTTHSSAAADSVGIPENNTTCYAYESATDTVLMTLTTTASDVSGNLTYAYSAKDRNSGTF